jgi:rhamnosyltransferase
MLIDNSNKNRVAIYFFYDAEGIVDKYVDYFLRDLNKNLDRLIVIVNGKLTPEGRKTFNMFTKELIVRENKGFDVGAYKEGLEHIGWNNMDDIDELVLCNFTQFGPLYPFSEMFEEMNTRDIDFWGITKHYKLNIDPWGICEYGYIPEHIQSSFIVVRNTLLNSYEYKKFWKDITLVESYNQAISKYEGIFTKKFNDFGFTSDTYINTDEMEENHPYPLMKQPLLIIKEKNCPVFKRRSFFNDYQDVLAYTSGGETVKLIDYIKNESNYPVDLVYDNILRCCNMADIKLNMKLNFIVNDKFKEDNVVPNKRHKVALVMHCYFDDLIEYCNNYACSMPNYAHVYITTDTKQKKDKIDKIYKDNDFAFYECRIIENRGRDVSALLVGCKDIILNYDYVCFAHDKKVTQLDLGIKGEEFSYKCFENILSSKLYVENIITLFDNNDRLGLISPSPPNHSDYYSTLGLEWMYNYDNTIKLANDLKLTVPISRDKPPIAPLGTMFWFRAKALKTLVEYDFEYKDFPKEPNNTNGTFLHAVERIYPYVVQNHGYFCGYVATPLQANLELTNLSYMIRELNLLLFQIYGANSFYGLTNTIRYYKDNYGSVHVDNRYVVKMRLKEKLPRPLFILAVKIKRLLFGPRGLKGNY